jgi:hypothetical protein
MNRRAILGGVVSAALAGPLTAAAQPAGKVYRIGFLGGGSPAGYAAHVAAMRLGLKDHGTSRARTPRWSSGGPRESTTGCPYWRPSWSVSTSTSS